MKFKHIENWIKAILCASNEALNSVCVGIEAERGGDRERIERLNQININIDNRAYRDKWL